MSMLPSACKQPLDTGFKGQGAGMLKVQLVMHLAGQAAEVGCLEVSPMLTRLALKLFDLSCLSSQVHPRLTHVGNQVHLWAHGAELKIHSKA